MDPVQKIDQGRFLIDRFDHYNDSINNKGSFYIGINTFILGGLCIGYTSYLKELKCSSEMYPWLLFVAIITLFCCLISIFFTVIAIMPYLKDNHVNDDQPSLIYFGGISKFPCNSFVEKFVGQSEASMLIDCSRQVHSLAMGLSKKYRRLSWASRFLLLEYIFLVIIIFLLFKTL